MSKKFLTLLLIFLFFFCAKRNNIVKEENVEELFHIGLKTMAENRHDEAIKYFTKIVNEYPHTNFLIKSQFLLAECYFQKKDYERAKGEYQFYIKTFPHAEDYENALYKSLVCELNLLKKSQNISTLEELKEKFLEFQINYPESKFSKEIPVYINYIDSLMAKIFFDIALLYYKNGELIPAKIYLEHIKNNFPKTPIKFYSLYYLAEISYKNNELSRAEEYLKEIIKEGNNELKLKAKSVLAKWKK